MKKILILLGLITSLIGAGQALAASSHQTLSCTLADDPANAGKFASLGYDIARFEITVTGNEAFLTIVHGDGATTAIGGVGTVGTNGATTIMGWDYNEHWAELTQEDATINGTIAVEQDFAFDVSCQESL